MLGYRDEQILKAVETLKCGGETSEVIDWVQIFVMTGKPRPLPILQKISRKITLE